MPDSWERRVLMDAGVPPASAARRSAAGGPSYGKAGETPALPGRTVSRFAPALGSGYAGLGKGCIVASTGPIPLGLGYDYLGGYGSALAALAAIPVTCASAVIVMHAPRPEQSGEVSIGDAGQATHRNDDR